MTSRPCFLEGLHTEGHRLPLSAYAAGRENVHFDVEIILSWRNCIQENIEALSVYAADKGNTYKYGL